MADRTATTARFGCRDIWSWWPEVAESSSHRARRWPRLSMPTERGLALLDRGLDHVGGRHRAVLGLVVGDAGAHRVEDAAFVLGTDLAQELVQGGRHADAGSVLQFVLDLFADAVEDHATLGALLQLRGDVVQKLADLARGLGGVNRLHAFLRDGLNGFQHGEAPMLKAASCRYPRYMKGAVFQIEKPACGGPFNMLTGAITRLQGHP
jgi:hypothetical protein